MVNQKDWHTKSHLRQDATAGKAGICKDLNLPKSALTKKVLKKSSTQDMIKIRENEVINI